jgi:methyl-accepting chemotaxis protein
MGKFSGISTRAKLFWSFGFMVLLLATVSSIAYRNAERLQASQRALLEDDFSVASNLMALRNGINRERVALLSLVLAGQEQQPALRKMAERESAEIDNIMNALNSHRKDDEVLAQRIEQLAQARRGYLEARDRSVLPALELGRSREAGVAILGPLQEQFGALQAIADDTGQRQWARAEQRLHDAEELVIGAQATLVTANAIAIIIGLLLVFWLDRIIARPLLQATAMARQIATGDLTVRLPEYAGKDEVGELLRALDAMVREWKHSIGETNTGIVTLSAAASEILAGAMQAAAGATETAAAVSETTVTVEEVKQTALMASEKASTVSDAAQKAVQTADLGRRAIEGGVDGMESIQEQMGTIAETIVRLSERSQAIAEIIATVGGLAEQSNLLAVNAAIEAAKAGDQGKGFAVVAQEVKDLAEQSRQATRQVRVILGDIQKAVSAAVMTTEQGSRTVASGVRQATEAGQAIRVLEDSIADAAQMAAQIAATSQQQLAGMDQVAVAMENIKQASAEHAAGSRQSEASARNLHVLGEKLRQISERFKL